MSEKLCGTKSYFETLARWINFRNLIGVPFDLKWLFLESKWGERTEKRFFLAKNRRHCIGAATNRKKRNLTKNWIINLVALHSAKLPILQRLTVSLTYFARAASSKKPSRSKRCQDVVRNDTYSFLGKCNHYHRLADPERKQNSCKLKYNQTSV